MEIILGMWAVAASLAAWHYRGKFLEADSQAYDACAQLFDCRLRHDRGLAGLEVDTAILKTATLRIVAMPQREML